MKLKVLSRTGKALKELTLPEQFKEAVRPDLIKRAVLALQSWKRQPYGANPEAGKRHSVKLSKRRRRYRGSYGYGISRVPRKILSRRGTRFNWEGAFAPGTVGGRRAHPPKSWKNWVLKINKKEKRKAVRSAMAATLVKELVQERGHKAPEQYPFIAEPSFEELSKTKEVVDALNKLGFGAELERCSEAKERAGKGNARGRRKRVKKGLLIVTSQGAKVLKAANNIPGVDAVPVNSLNAELLAPGTHPGRITLFTEQAMKELEENKLFTSEVKQ